MKISVSKIKSQISGYAVASLYIRMCEGLVLHFGLLKQFSEETKFLQPVKVPVCVAIHWLLGLLLALFLLLFGLWLF
jgi:hypothetical protein